MTVFDERPAVLSKSRQRLWLLALPLLAALGWAGVTLSHHAQAVQGALHEFRGDPAADPGPNRAMDAALDIRKLLLLHRSLKLSTRQSAVLVGLVNSPVDDQSQSEALDVLGLAQRAHALSSIQAERAQAATLRVLRGSPGPMVRLESARFLGHLGKMSSAPALTRLQQDSDFKVRLAATRSLAGVRR